MKLAHEHLRVQCVSGSELAALYGLHPYLTKLKLWHIKRGTELPEEPDSDPAKRGKYFEDGVARWAANELGATILPTSVFLQRLDMPYLGCTPDRYLDIGGEVVPLECKTMNYWAARKYPDRDIPPEHYAIQTELAAMLKGAPMGYLAIYFTSEDVLKIYPIPVRPEKRDEYIRLANDFMNSVRMGEEPEASGEDIELLKTISKTANAGLAPVDVLDLSGNNYLVDRCAEYLENSSKIKQLEAFQDKLKADILQACLGNPCRKVKLGGFEVAFTERASSPDKIITQDMVGTVIKGRAGSTSITIKKGK